MEVIDNLSLKSGENIELIKVGGDKTNKTILVIGVFHGEEPQGYFAIQRYLKDLSYESNSKNTIYFVPCLNPDGMKKNTRKNSNGVDLNRNFPTKNWELTDKNDEFFGGNLPKSEEETAFIISAIKKIKPDIILTLHSPFAIVNYDGNAKNIANKISEFTNYPVQEDIGYPTPGSFGTYCGIERNIPTVTLEFCDKEEMQSIILKSKKIFDYLLVEFE